MCTPALGAISAISSIATGVLGEVSNIKSNRDNYKYRTQVALNNAKIAQDEALRQQQLGIEKSRLEKIEGIQKANKLKAINSASGFDLNSQTNTLAYQDVTDLADYNAENIKKEYEVRADSYFNQANSYLNSAKQARKEYNQSLFDYSLNALGKIQNVAGSWYSN